VCAAGHLAFAVATDYLAPSIDVVIRRSEQRELPLMRVVLAMMLLATGSPFTRVVS